MIQLLKSSQACPKNFYPLALVASLRDTLNTLWIPAQNTSIVREAGYDSVPSPLNIIDTKAKARSTSSHSPGPM